MGPVLRPCRRGTSLTIPSENLQYASVSGAHKIHGRQATLRITVVEDETKVARALREG